MPLQMQALDRWFESFVEPVTTEKVDTNSLRTCHLNLASFWDGVARLISQDIRISACFIQFNFLLNSL